jgi:hypothetical protein
MVEVRYLFIHGANVGRNFEFRMLNFEFLMRYALLSPHPDIIIILQYHIMNTHIISISFAYITCSWLLSLLFFAVFKNSYFVKTYQLPRLLTGYKANKLLGVYVFGLLITKSFFRHLNPRVYLTGKKYAEFLRVQTEIEYAAKTHYLAFGGVLIVSLLFAILSHNLLQFGVISVANVIFNLYPVLALQLQGGRIGKLIYAKAKSNSVER